ncbi:MAG TPA: hypothetical protein PLH65_00740 [bacterium]|nr:hypothetical protein [bacterium]HPN67716.1 hypothetical protein [bacterium]
MSNLFSIDGHITEEMARLYKDYPDRLSEGEVCALLCHTSECNDCYISIKETMMNKNEVRVELKKNNDLVEYYFLKSNHKCGVVEGYIYDYINNEISEIVKALFVEHLGMCNACHEKEQEARKQMQKKEKMVFSANGDLCEKVKEVMEEYKNGWLSRMTMAYIDTHLLLCHSCNNEWLRGDKKYNGRFAVGGVKMAED